jgi:predicted O-methyltransferase YrrM
MERWNTPLPLLGSPAFFSRDLMWTVMMSLEDQRPPTNDRLLEIALAVASRSRHIDLVWLAGLTTGEEREFVNHWPGEHYRFLAGCVQELRPRLIVEVGTYTGLSALSMKSVLAPGASIVTYDVVPWRHLPTTALREIDFDGRLEQRIGDLSDESYFNSQMDTLRDADLILLDGPKDGRFEPSFLRLFLPLFSRPSALLVIDDIRFINMIQLWRDLPRPKLDITSFGHWTGTGLVVPR